MSRNISMPRPGDWDNFSGSQNTEVPPELGKWVTADDVELGETARQMYEWRRQNGGKGMRYASYDAPTNGAFGQTSVSAASYTEANHIDRLEDLFYGFDFADELLSTESLVIPDPSEIIFRLEDIEYYRYELLQLLSIKVLQGIEDPMVFSPHACDGHGEDIVSETCAMVNESIQRGDYALTPVLPKTVSKLKIQRGITGYRRLELSPKNTVPVSEGPYCFPIILATILKYDPTLLENCNFALPSDVLPEILLIAGALAGLSVQEMFRPTKKGKGKLRVATTDLTRVFKGREFGFLRKEYAQLLEICSDNQYVGPEEKLALMQDIFVSYGVSRSDLPIFKISPGVGSLGVKPVIVFSNFFESVRLNNRRGLSDNEIAKMEEYCVGKCADGYPICDFYTGEPVTAFTKIVVTNSKKQPGSGYDLLDILRRDGFIY